MDTSNPPSTLEMEMMVTECPYDYDCEHCGYDCDLTNEDLIV